MAVCWAGTAGMAGTKGLGAGAGSTVFSGTGTTGSAGLAVTEAGAWPRALVGVRFTVSLGGQMGWTLSATLAVERHSVFQEGLTGAAGDTGCGRKAGWAALGGWAGAGDFTMVGATAGFVPCSRYALAFMD